MLKVERVYASIAKTSIVRGISVVRKKLLFLDFKEEEEK